MAIQLGKLARLTDTDDSLKPGKGCPRAITAAATITEPPSTPACPVV